MNVDDARSVLLSLSGAYESEHHGHPDFRVKAGIFATLWPDQGRSVLRLPPALAESLEARSLEDFKVVSRMGDMGWISIALQAMELEEFQSLADAAWQARGEAR